MVDPQVGWSDKDLLQSVRRYVGSGYNQDAPDFAQFCHVLAKVIRKRRATVTSVPGKAPSVFVMAPLPDTQEQPERHPMFDRGHAELAGKAWFGAKRLAQASSLALPATDDASVVDFLVSALGVADAPTVYYDPADGAVLRLYPYGMGKLDECEELSLDGSSMSLSYIHNVMSSLHEELLETSSASESQRELWANRSKWWPINESEKGIQKILYGALKGHLLFSSLQIKQEDPSNLGRCDFILREQDPCDSSVWTHHAILELKVVKSHTHTGSDVADSTNKTAVSDGLDQTRDYKTSHSCRLGALCVYDMRKKPDPKEAIEHEVKRAADEGLGLWSWPVYNTAKAARARRGKVPRPRRRKSSV